MTELTRYEPDIPTLVNDLPLVLSAPLKEEWGDAQQDSDECDDPYFYYEERTLSSGHTVKILLNLRGHSNIKQLKSELEKVNISASHCFIEGIAKPTADAQAVRGRLPSDCKVFKFFSMNPLSLHAFEQFRKILGVLQFETNAPALWNKTLPEILSQYFETNDSNTHSSTSLMVPHNGSIYTLKPGMEKKFLDNVAWLSISAQISAARFVNAWLVYRSVFKEIDPTELDKRLQSVLNRYDSAGVFENGKGDYLKLVSPLLKAADASDGNSGFDRSAMGLSDFKLLMGIVNKDAARRIYETMQIELQFDSSLFFYAGGEHRAAIDMALDMLESRSSLEL